MIDCACPTTSGSPDASTSVADSGSAIPAREGPIAVAIVSMPNSNGDVIHEVKFGQTPWQLAIAYNVKIDEIKSLNSLFDNSIYPGNKLLIKRGVVQHTAAHTETSTVDLTMISTNTPLLTATIIRPTLTSTKVMTPAPLSRPTNNIMANSLQSLLIILPSLDILEYILFDFINQRGMHERNSD